jgi:hypothetical protein
MTSFEGADFGRACDEPDPADLMLAGLHEREAHLREVGRFSQTLPEGSCGRHNRQATAEESQGRWPH